MNSVLTNDTAVANTSSGSSPGSSSS